MIRCKYFGIHKWRNIRRTHHNQWMGRVCEDCGKTQELSMLTGQYEDVPFKKDLNFIERNAGGYYEKPR